MDEIYHPIIPIHPLDILINAMWKCISVLVGFNIIITPQI